MTPHVRRHLAPASLFVAGVLTFFSSLFVIVGVDLHHTGIATVNLSSKNRTVSQGVAEVRFTSCYFDHDWDVAKVLTYLCFSVSHGHFYRLSIITLGNGTVGSLSICYCTRA